MGNYRYPAIKSGEWQYPKLSGYNLACCDCGLVHWMHFAVVKRGGRYVVAFRIYRNKNETRKIRSRGTHKYVSRRSKLRHMAHHAGESVSSGRSAPACACKLTRQSCGVFLA